MAYSIPMIILLVCITVALFIMMGYSAMEATKAKDLTCAPDGKAPSECQKRCHSYATWSAVVAGILGLGMLIMCGFYFYNYSGDMKGEVVAAREAMAGVIVPDGMKLVPDTPSARASASSLGGGGSSLSRGGARGP